MDVRIVREEVKPVEPPVKEVVLRLTLKEAQVLYSVGNCSNKVTRALCEEKSTWLRVPHEQHEVNVVLKDLYEALQTVPRRA